MAAGPRRYGRVPFGLSGSRHGGRDAPAVSRKGAPLRRCYGRLKKIGFNQEILHISREFYVDLCGKNMYVCMYVYIYIYIYLRRDIQLYICDMIWFTQYTHSMMFHGVPRIFQFWMALDLQHRMIPLCSHWMWLVLPRGKSTRTGWIKEARSHLQIFQWLQGRMAMSRMCNSSLVTNFPWFFMLRSAVCENVGWLVDSFLSPISSDTFSRKRSREQSSRNGRRNESYKYARIGVGWPTPVAATWVSWTFSWNCRGEFAGNFFSRKSE